jgi:hypothetical protein
LVQANKQLEEAITFLELQNQNRPQKEIYILSKPASLVKRIRLYYPSAKHHKNDRITAGS